MMIDQAGVVMTKMTHIDRLKGGDDGGSSLEGVVEVFGLGSSIRRLDKKSGSNLSLGMDNNNNNSGAGWTPAPSTSSAFRADWLSPFHRICFPTSVHDEIMGFCRPCGGGGGGHRNLGSPTTTSASERDFGGDTEMSQRLIRGVEEIV
jgi:hypothetical protein